MLTYKKGCLISALRRGEVQAIAHQSNCFNTMGSGVALAVKRAFPEAEAADLATTKGDRRKLGGYTVASTTDGLVFNLYGQYNYGKDGAKYTDYFALEESMANMALKLRSLEFTGKIGIPLIGAGTGGGRWDAIERIVLKTLSDWEVTVYTL